MAGFTGNGHSCANINECQIHGEESESRHRCDSNAQCADSPGSYSCTCNVGFNGNGVDCDGKGKYWEYSLKEFHEHKLIPFW